MKIQEFRDKLKGADRAALEKIAAELYRKVPKAVKDQELDAAIDQLLRGETPVRRASASELPFPELKKQIDTFLERVDSGYYIGPNRVVPAAQRSKWRFEVMRFLKQLDRIPADDPNAAEAAELYLHIYQHLAYGCGICILPSEDPFRSINSRQGDLYPRLARRTFDAGFTDERILEMLRAATSVFIDRESVYWELESSFVVELRTRDMRKKAYGIARAELLRLEKLLETKGSRPSDSDRYDLERACQQIVCTIVGLGIALFEVEDAFRFYWEHTGEYTQEHAYSLLLSAINVFEGGEALWLETYEKAASEGVELNRSFQAEYQMKLNNRRS